MTSEAKARAARENGRKSRGPKTSEGKARSSTNGLRHGLRSSLANLLLWDEDQAAFDRLRDAVVADLQPVGDFESELAQRVAVALWRMRRLEVVEAGTLDYFRAVQLAREAHDDHRAQAFRADTFTMIGVGRTDLEKARYADARIGETGARIARAFNMACESKTWDSLARYSAAIERSMRIALATLRERQAERSGVVSVALLPSEPTQEPGSRGGPIG